MIHFDVNQQAGKIITLKIWQAWLKNIEKILKLKKNFEISLALVSNKAIKDLNARCRQKNQVTDVLSFAEEKSGPTTESGFLGEIIICYPQAAKQAKVAGWPVSREIEMLLVHGFLHLLGYDHERAEEAARMEKLQIKILGNKNKNSKFQISNFKHKSTKTQKHESRKAEKQIF